MGIYIVPTFIANIVSILMIVASEQGYSCFQVTGMIEWGQISIPKTILRTSNNTQKIPGPKLGREQMHSQPALQPGGGTWVFLGWVCAARDSKLAPHSKKNFP